MCLKVRVLPSFLGKQTELLWRRFKGVRAVRVPWTGAIRSLRNRSGMWSAESCHSFWPQKYWVTQEKWGSKFLSKPFVPRFIAFHRTRWATAFAKPSMISSSAPWPVESAAVLWCPKEWNLINSSGTNVVFLSWFSIDFCFLPYFFCGFFWANTWARCPDRGDLGEMRRDYIQTVVKSNAWQSFSGIIWDLGVCLGQHIWNIHANIDDWSWFIMIYTVYIQCIQFHATVGYILGSKSTLRSTSFGGQGASPPSGAAALAAPLVLEGP